MRQTDRAGDPRVRVASAVQRWWPVLGVVGLLGLATAAATFSAPRVTQLPPWAAPNQTLPSEAGSAESDQVVVDEGGRSAPLLLPTWMVRLALYLCLALAIAAIAALIWAALRDRIAVRRAALLVERGGTPSEQHREEVVAALDAGLDELSDIDADPRRAVIACWVRLEHAAAAAGTPRQLGDTSTDLVVRLLDAHRVDRRVLDRFAQLYRAARYATQLVDERMRVEALAALRQLRAELTAGAVASPGSATSP